MGASTATRVPDVANARARERGAARALARTMSHAAPLLALLVAIALALAVAGVSTIRGRSRDFSRFFSSIDGDGDGSLTMRELSRYLEGGNGETASGRDALKMLDSDSDEDETVSPRELRLAATTMLSPHEVERWVRHGVGLGEFAREFRERGLTLLDFPTLLANDGAELEEIGVGVGRRRERLIRAMKRQLLRVGRAPSMPRRVTAHVEDDFVRITWRRPKDLGSPETHEYEVQTAMGVGGTVLKWSHAISVDSSTFTARVSGLSRAPGVRHKFSVVAWNEFGHSADASSNWVATGIPVTKKATGQLSAVISFLFAFRFVVASRGIIARFCFLLVGLVKFAIARARGDDEISVRECAAKARSFIVREPSSPVATNIITDRKLFTPTKVLTHERQSSVSESGDLSSLHRTQSMSSLKEQARANLNEAEFSTGAGGSDGFSPVYQSLLTQHSFAKQMRVVDHDREESLRQRASRPLSIHKCNEDGCKVSWKQSARIVRHFCGLCQAWYCEGHTQVSPHGKRGTCKPESQCVCQYCYNDLSLEQQKELDEDNAYSLNGAQKVKRSPLAKLTAKIRRSRVKAKQRAGDNVLLQHALDDDAALPTKTIR